MSALTSGPVPANVGSTIFENVRKHVTTRELWAFWQFRLTTNEYLKREAFMWSVLVNTVNTTPFEDTNNGSSQTGCLALSSNVVWFNWQMLGTANSNKRTNRKYQNNIKLYLTALTVNGKRRHCAHQKILNNKMNIIQHKGLSFLWRIFRCNPLWNH